MAGRRETRHLGSSRSRRTLILVAILIVVLVVVDVALVTLALTRSTASAGSEALPAPTYSSSVPPPAASPSPSPTASAQATGSGRYLSAVNGQEAWRATDGTCGGTQPTLEHTLDAGTTWTPIVLETDVSSLLGIRAVDGRLTMLAGIGDGCTPTVRSTTDAGLTWSASAAGSAGAGVSPAGVVLSTGLVNSPCSDPVEAFQGKQTAVVVCDGQLEWRSGTGAWVDVPLGGVRSMADAGDHYSLARVGTDTCAGVQIESMPAVAVTPATTTRPVGCDADASTHGPISMARAGDDVWLWTGDTVSVSRDGGRTW